MADQAETLETRMKLTSIPGTSLRVSPVAIGTWAIGGWMWGGTDEAESIATIRTAFEHGINLVDTAPVYGFGRSEEIVGRAIAESGLRSNVLIATKAGLQWEGGKVSRNASRARIMWEVEESLRRLRTDYIDIYQVHWPDPLIAIEETADAMHPCSRKENCAIGVSNYSVLQMERPHRAARCCGRPVCSNAGSTDLRPHCRGNKIAMLGYGALCRGLAGSECGQVRFSVATIEARIPVLSLGSRNSGGRHRQSARSAVSWQARHSPRSQLMLDRASPPLGGSPSHRCSQSTKVTDGRSSPDMAK
jgi:aryl-alcohol dehydrogenase-like predicted oxidoreductase